MTERLIREAQETGGFDDLPGQGRRLDLDDDPREGEMGLAFHILRTNQAVPPWIAADLEARRCVNDIERLLSDAAQAGRHGRATPGLRAGERSRLLGLVRDHDRAVDALGASAPSVTLHRPRLARATLEARLGNALDGCPDEAPAPP
ncbi:MAG: DUF1992 domain-containing protein [Chloroflexota bacterium]